MKKQIPALVFLLLSIPASAIAQYYLESDGLLVIEAESTDISSAFLYESDLPGYKGTGYLRSKFEFRSAPGFRSIRYPVYIRNAGTYQIALRSRADAEGTDTPANSSFVRLLDEAGSPVLPVPNANVASTDSWYSLYNSAGGDWSHPTSNNATAPRALGWEMETDSEYTLEVSIRSKDHLLDRVILWDRSLYSFADITTGESTAETALNDLIPSNAGSAWTYSADLTNPQEIYPFLDLVFEFQATNEVDGPRNQGIIGWKHATFYTGVMELYRATGDTFYKDYLTGISEANDWRMLVINNALWRHADNHLMGETYTNLYLEDERQDPVRVAHVTEIFDRMIAQPWTGRRLYDWCDALFMSPPVWALLGSMYQDDRYFEELDRLWWDATDYLYDAEWNLYYRDASYFNSVEANGSPTFWGRGNGWVMGGLARVLDYLPRDWAGRDAFVDLFVEMSGRIASLQMDSGGWPASMLYPARFGYETEMSATSFFVYALSWGINNGILDRTSFGPVVERGWMEMSNYVTEAGGIQHIQVVGKEPGPVNDNLTEREYGYGAFLLAGVEMADYYRTEQTWLGYPYEELDGLRWANTGDFMGILEISRDPYVYVVDLGSWAYVPESRSEDNNGQWIYVIR
jgi:rhamnogalacturonyl hydrolase YesR